MELKDIPFKSVLRRLASQSPCEMRHASVVLRGGSLLSWGFNHNDRHSEMAALLKLWSSERKGTTVINLRIRKDGSFALAKPCGDCQYQMKDMEVRNVFYSTPEGWEGMDL